MLIDTRLAADALGATPMDRPEDAQPRGDGTAYIMLTNNSKRKDAQVNVANPRAKSNFGHIIEIKEAAGDHAATTGTWSILVKCGDPDSGRSRCPVEPGNQRERLVRLARQLRL